MAADASGVIHNTPCPLISGEMSKALCCASRLSVAANDYFDNFGWIKHFDCSLLAQLNFFEM